MPRQRPERMDSRMANRFLPVVNVDVEEIVVFVPWEGEYTLLVFWEQVI